MLVLTRKENQTIQIGEEITINVLRAGNGKVKIGVEAPPELLVLRGELTERVPQASFE